MAISSSSVRGPFDAPEPEVEAEASRRSTLVRRPRRSASRSSSGSGSGSGSGSAGGSGGRLPPWGRALYLLVLGIATAAFVYPLLWLISASLKPKTQTFDNRLLPQTVHLRNFVDVFQAAPVLQWLLNSVLVGVMAATAVTLSSSLVAFGFAYFRFRLRGPLFALVLATMMLPGAVTMIPVYLIWNRLGFVDTQVPLWAQNLFGSAFYIFLLRQFFLGVPRELFEAARVDGCSFLRMFWKIALPLCRPALVIVFVFELQASWSDLMKPLIYLQTQQYFTMPRGLKQLIDAFALSGQYEWNIALAATVLATVPMILVFAFAQRYLLDGIATSAQKG